VTVLASPAGTAPGFAALTLLGLSRLGVSQPCDIIIARHSLLDAI
jgi:hypothetical protein